MFTINTVYFNKENTMVNVEFDEKAPPMPGFIPVKMYGYAEGCTVYIRLSEIKAFIVTDEEKKNLSGLKKLLRAGAEHGRV